MDNIVQKDINTLSVVLDYIKGLNKKQLQGKYKITEEECQKILNRHEAFINLVPKDIVNTICSLTDKDVDNETIANLLNINIKIVNHFCNKRFTMKYIKRKYSGLKRSKKEIIESKKCNIIFDFYHSGGAELDLEKSDVSSYLVNSILNNGVSYNEIEGDELEAYKYIVAKAYDMSIINDVMLECLFNIDHKGIEKIKREECSTIQDSTCNLLYNIYKNPELLSDITFTNSDIEEKANDFRRNREQSVNDGFQYSKKR